MAKGSKKAKGSSASTAKRTRTERRFFPQSTFNPLLVKVMGAVAAALLGAGAWGQYGRLLTNAPGEPPKFALWLFVAGALLLGLAIWLGTSGDSPIYVGDAGVGVEQSSIVRHIPWHQIASITWDGSKSSVVVQGKDESAGDLTIRASVRSQPQAAAWIVAEARSRVASVCDVPDSAGLPSTIGDAGESLTLEPLQVVGKRCAKSGKIIAYEPDARVCARCERVYHKDSWTQTCVCGG